MTATRPNNPKVFDINNPQRAKPNPTSRPIITGHRPQAADPMVRQRPATPGVLKPIATAKKTDELQAGQPELQAVPVTPVPEPAEAPITGVHEKIDEANNSLDEPPKLPPLGGHDPHPPNITISSSAPNTEQPEHFEMRWWTWLLLLLAAAAIGAYLAIDSGLLKANINLPFHIFKQDTASTATTSSSEPVATMPITQPVAAVPSNWQTFVSKSLGLSFKHPKSWQVTEQANPKCKGSVITSITAPASELKNAMTTMVTPRAKKYQIALVSKGVVSKICSNGGLVDYTNNNVSQSSVAIKSGLLKGGQISWLGPASSSTELGLLTTKNYNAKDRLLESGIVLNGLTRYQVLASVIGPDIAIPFDVSGFQKTSLFSTSNLILNSVAL